MGIRKTEVHLMGKGLTKGDLFIGALQLPDRKRPSFVIRVGDQVNILGSFKSEECVEQWVRALIHMFEGEVRDG